MPSHSRRTPTNPTAAIPGTDAKLQVLIRRHERGEFLWHPCDAGMDSAGQARLQIHDKAYNRVGWRIVDEKAYRRENRDCSFWEAADDDRDLQS